MDILLDTHAVLWFLDGNEKMPIKTRDIICNSENRKYISMASLWEIAIKSSSGKLNLDGGIDGLIEAIEDNGFRLLLITSDHIKTVTGLLFIHRDPFDRMIVAQAMTEHMDIVTVDENILKYDVNVIW